MLPASLHIPAAVILVLGGLLACFAGYRVFRTVLGIYGFILGALLATNIIGSEHSMLTIVLTAVAGGIVGAVLLILAYFVGVALIGAGLGAMAVNLVWAWLGREPHVAVVIVVAILGALAALALQRYVIIVATAFGGAQTVVVGAAALLGSGMSPEAARAVYSVYPLDPMPETMMDSMATLALGIAGIAVQLLWTAGGSQAKR